jgi:NAD(P)-dependent dehydrogenase (short-subunit alcohol dehydrogenase family)
MTLSAMKVYRRPGERHGLALSQSAAQEYAADGIRVNALVAGGFDTEMLRTAVRTLCVATQCYPGSMTVTLEIRPEVEAELARQAAAQGRALEAYAATVLEEAVRGSVTSSRPPRSGQELIDACAKVRGLLTDEEIDTVFSRTFSFPRPLDLA